MNAFAWRLGIALVCVLQLSGCISMMSSMSSEPMDRHHGKRTLGAFIEDQAIENKTRINLNRASEELANSHLKVISYNANVLLAGEVANDELKSQAGNIARRIRHVRQLHNELQVHGASSFFARMNDAWLTTKVKMRLYVNGEAPGGRTKVATVNGVVYLMGLLTREEAKAVVTSVQKVYGVQKIVKIIEYIENP